MSTVGQPAGAGIASVGAERLALWLAVTVSAISIGFALLGFPVIGHDAYVHLNWLDQFTRLREQGIWYPRWLPDSFGGFGSPVFYYYPPLPFFLASAIHSVVALSPTALFHVLQVAASLLAVATSYRMFGEWSSVNTKRWTASLLYAFAAYHFCDVYTRSALGEQFALAFLPIIFWRMRGVGGIAVYTLAWAGLLFTNLPMAVLALLSVAAWQITSRDKQVICAQAAGGVLALAVCSFYLLPLPSLSHQIHTTHLFDLFPSNPYGYSVLNVLERKLDWLRVEAFLLLVAGAVVLVRNWRELGVMRGVLMLAIIMQVPYLADPFWLHVPSLHYVQYAWRWSAIVQLVLLLIAVRSSRDFSWIAVGLALITLLPALTLSRNLIQTPPPAVDSYRMDAPEYTPVETSADPLQTIALTKRRMSEPPALLLGLTDALDSVSLQNRNGEQWFFRVHLARETPVRFHMLYWPYWRIRRLDDSSSITSAPDPNGFMTATLPAGNYTIQLWLLTRFMYDIANGISLAGAAVLVVLLTVAAYRTLQANDRSLSSVSIARTGRSLRQTVPADTSPHRQ